MGGEGSVRRGAGVTDPLCLPFANFFVCYPSNSSFIEGRSYGEKVCPPHNFLFFNFYLPFFLCVCFLLVARAGHVRPTQRRGRGRGGGGGGHGRIS